MDGACAEKCLCGEDGAGETAEQRRARRAEQARREKAQEMQMLEASRCVPCQQSVSQSVSQ
eukprot:COSAG01_NODE_11764_length_1863_cov_2.842971_1_plen_60_part_10